MKFIKMHEMTSNALDERILQAFFPYTPRPIQIKAIKAILNAYKANQIPVIEAPAGSGKSIIAYALSNLLGTAWLVTPRTSLQRQYQREFPQYPVGMGKSHYPDTVIADGKYDQDPKVRGFDDEIRLADKLYEVMGRPVYGMTKFQLPRPSYAEVLAQVHNALDTDVDADRAAIAEVQKEIGQSKDDPEKVLELKEKIKEIKSQMRGKTAKWIAQNQKFARYKSTSPVYLRNLVREDYDPYYKDVYGRTFFQPVSILNHGILSEYVCKRTHARTHDTNVAEQATGDNVFYRRKVVIIDEAHLLRKMGQWIGDLPINQYQLACLYGKEDAPKVKEYFELFKSKRDLIGHHAAACEVANQFVKDLTGDTGEPTVLNKKLVKLFAVLTDPTIELSPEARKKLKFQLDHLLSLKETYDHLHFLNWEEAEYTVQIKGGELKFKLQNVAPMLDHYLYSTGHFQLFMSATIGDAEVFKNNFMQHDKHRVKVIQLEDTFNYDRSPIVCKRVFDAHEEDMDIKYEAVSAEVKRLIEERPNERGIISCTSFEQVKEIYKRVNDPRMICHNGIKKLPDAMRLYKESENGVLLSPSIKEGLDLKDDLCRFIIIPKLPWDPLGEPADWYYYRKHKNHFYNDMLTSLTQAIGRSNRHQNDWSHIFILDEKSHYWLPRLRKNPLLQRWLYRIKYE